jgi:acyl-CoA thioester hydrolase
MTEFHWTLRVYYEDTDAGGVVYYANYLKFLERARTEWLRQVGLDQQQLARDNNTAFAVRHVEIDYLKPARLDDELVVRSHVHSQGRASITFSQQIDRADGLLLCSAMVKVVCLQLDDFKPKPLPENLIAELQNVS